MIDFMYILAAPSPLHEPALKASFEKYKPLCLNLSFYKIRNASLVIFSSGQSTSSTSPIEKEDY